jgi:two-component sensor histidine kinase/CBS domain-containing protein
MSMQRHNQPPSKSTLESAIDSHPLTVGSDAVLGEVIAMMGKAQASCTLPPLELSLDRTLKRQARANAIWVVEQAQLLGVVTVDVALRAIASNRDLSAIKIAEVMDETAIALTLANVDFNPTHPAESTVNSTLSSQDVFAALSLLRHHSLQYLPILDLQNHFVGVISLAGIRSTLQLDELLKSESLAHIVLAPVLQAPLTTPVLELAQLMSQHHSDCVFLVAPDQSEQLIGMILASDIIQLHRLEQDLTQIPGHMIMSAPLLCLPASQPALEAYWQMQQHQVQRFVVSENRTTWLGFVTPTSFLQTLDLAAMQSAEARLQESIKVFAETHPETEAEAIADDKTFNSAELLEQLECSRLLSTMALHIRESLNLNEILQTAVDEVRQFLQTERVVIYRFNPDMSGVVTVESLAPGWQPSLNSAIQDSCFGKDYAQAYKAGRIQVVEDIYTTGLSQCHIDILVLFDIRASLVVPILQGEHLWGLLCAYHCSEPRSWRSFEVDLLKQLAIHVAIAIQQSELYQQAQTELAERKRIEEQIKLSLKEKESLLKEIHHRVKNNLQIISSVLRLQSDYIKDDKVLPFFHESQNRIRSMALIHEKLYQSKDLSRIGMSEYIRDLSDNLLRSYVAVAQSVVLHIEADDIWLDIDTAIPCGLIINELVSNALKHAFQAASCHNESHDNPNVIRVNMSCVEDHLKLTVSDNGVGLPEAIDFRNTDSLGLELVCIFTEQLGGTIELNNDQGAHFTITFPQNL